MNAWLQNPNVAAGAVLAGVVIGAVEFLRPGWVIPGTVGGVLLLLGVAGLWEQPVQPVGLVLLLAGVGLMVADAVNHWNGWGAMAAAGLALAGVRLLVSSRISWVLAVCGSVTLLAGWRLLQFAVQARVNKGL